MAVNQTKPPKEKTAFRVKKTYSKILRRRKQKIERRLDAKRVWSDQPEPMMTASNVHYEMAEKSRAINCGGLEPFI